MWSKDQKAKWARAAANAEKHKQAIEKLKALAKRSPDFTGQVEELETRREYLETMSQIALSADDEE